MLSILYSLFVYKLLTVAITSEYIVNILYSMINTHSHTIANNDVALAEHHWFTAMKEE
jgi:hypothetical protein